MSLRHGLALLLNFGWGSKTCYESHNAIHQELWCFWESEFLSQKLVGQCSTLRTWCTTELLWPSHPLVTLFLSLKYSRHLHIAHYTIHPRMPLWQIPETNDASMCTLQKVMNTSVCHLAKLNILITTIPEQIQTPRSWHSVSLESCLGRRVVRQQSSSSSSVGLTETYHCPPGAHESQRLTVLVVSSDPAFHQYYLVYIGHHTIQIKREIELKSHYLSGQLANLMNTAFQCRFLGRARSGNPKWMSYCKPKRLKLINKWPRFQKQNCQSSYHT